ncbi:MAG: RNA polymerase factor sigma-54 [Hydrogenophilus sp.]|nr:RNA polymerase factor sigma-54 [Hydrogenophilus sp.]
MKSLAPTLNLKLQTTLTLSPQLQQALHLLTLPAVELQQTIHDLLERNPCLMLADELPGSPSDPLSSAPEESSLSTDPSPAGGNLEDPFPSPELDDPDESLYWEHVSNARHPDDDEIPDPLLNAPCTEDLRDELRRQAALVLAPQEIREHLYLLIEALDDDGYLRAPLEEIATWTDPPADLEILETALKLLQKFDPPGVGARTIPEALLLQLADHPVTPSRTLAEAIIRDHFDLLARHDYAQLCKRLCCSEEQLKTAVDLIQTLDPKPGLRYSAQQIHTVIPDLLVHPVEEGWRVTLNPAAYPKVVVSPLYEQQITRKSPAEWRDRLAEAKQFVKQLHQRALTLVRVGQAIVDHQADYFRHGETALKPLTLRTIAEQLELHESTVSRVVADKYLASPRGVIPLKRLFSARLATDDGADAAAAAIQSRIKAIIAAEDPRSPLSDQAIADRLAVEGIVIARRTVAKYRDLLAIPAAKLRKRL